MRGVIERLFRCLLLVSVALGVLVAAPMLARAQAPAPSASAGAPAGKPKLVPPEQLTFTTPAYPEGAEGDAEVLLALKIDKAGNVAQVTVVEGAPPFDAAAIAHAKTWRFRPATRDGAPINATIRARVRFIAPHVEPEPVPSASASVAASGSAAPSSSAARLSPSAAPSTSASATPPLPPDVVDIEVQGHRVELGTTVMGASDVRFLPGAFGDPFRAIEAMPGVTSIASGVPFFFIRGAPPGNSGYLIDGMRVPMLFHVGAGPSVISAGMIDQIDFQPGAFPAQYGRVTGGIIAGITKEPSTHFRAEWNLRLFDASALLETPLGKDGKTDVLVAGRYGYPGLIWSLVQNQTGLDYWDYQLRVGHRVTDRDRLSIFAFGAYDNLTDKKHHNEPIFSAQFHRIDLRWDHKLDGGSFRLASTVMIDRTNGGDPSTAGSSDSILSLGIGLRAELEKQLSEGIRLRAGADIVEQHYSLDAGNNLDAQTAASFATRTDVEGGIRADLVIKPSSAVQLVPGVRFDFFHQSGTTAVSVDPRLAASIRLTKKLTWINLIGLAHQAPTFPVPVPGLNPATLANGLQEVLQSSTGFEYQLPEKSSVKLTFFWHHFLKINDVFSVCAYNNDNSQFAQGNTNCDVDSRADGDNYGLELLARRDFTNRLSGWLSYTLSRAERRFGFGASAVSTVSDFDRTHAASLALGYDLGRGWRAGGRASYTSGRPQTTVLWTYGTPGDPSTIGLTPTRQKLPDFFRLDVRLEKRWEIGEGRYYAFTIEWFNALIAKEAISFDCPSAGSPLPDVTSGGGVLPANGSNACSPHYIGPVTIPSIGFEGAL